jgi:hypothetical protein
MFLTKRNRTASPSTEGFGRFYFPSQANFSAAELNWIVSYGSSGIQPKLIE